MNTGETNIGLNPVGLPGVLAPITRIGAGEVRVDKALASGTAAWAGTDVGAALSFGYQAVASREELEKKVTVKNYTSSGRWYRITPSFRFADDAASRRSGDRHAVPHPGAGRADAAGSRSRLELDPRRLPIWAAAA